MHTADEASELSELGLKIASYNCFQNQFAKYCQGFVREEIYNFYKAKMSQEPSPVVVFERVFVCLIANINDFRLLLS